MKAIPTRYAGCRFRSRLEARWAAFFDLALIEWDYEPIDLDGWAPDFAIFVGGETIYAEVKPIALKAVNGVGLSVPQDSPEYAKAEAHRHRYWVLKLGTQPSPHSDYFAIGTLMDPPKENGLNWLHVHDAIKVHDATTLWRIAGSRVQWRSAS